MTDVLLKISSCHEYLQKTILESKNETPTESCGKIAWVVWNPNIFNDHAFPVGSSERCTDHERTHRSESSFFSLLWANNFSILVSTRVLMETHIGLNKWLKLMDC